MNVKVAHPRKCKQSHNQASQSVSISESNAGNEDLSQLSSQDLLLRIEECNKDPVIGSMLCILAAKIPSEWSSYVEAERRGRTLIFSGIKEAEGDLPPSQQQMDVESKVTKVLDALNVQCRPTCIFRIGKPNASRSRLVKVTVPSKHHWRQALANARLLPSKGFSDVYVRKCMTMEERKREYELRQQAKELNNSKNEREWVVYAGELRRVSDLSRRSGNF